MGEKLSCAQSADGTCPAGRENANARKAAPNRSADKTFSVGGVHANA